MTNEESHSPSHQAQRIAYFATLLAAGYRHSRSGAGSENSTEKTSVGDAEMFVKSAINIYDAAVKAVDQHG